MSPRFKIIFIIFFLAIAVRFIYIGQIKNDVLFSYPTSDSGDYHRAGMKLAAGTLTEADRRKFSKMPLYHNFLELIYKTGGPGAYFSALAQAVIGGAGCCLIYLLGRSVFGDRAGAVAGVLAALYWPLAAFAAKTLPVNLAIFFSLLSALSIQKLYEKESRIWGYTGGLFLALAALVRPNFLLLFPVLILWLLFHFLRKSGKAKGILFSAIFAAGFITAMIPAGLADHGAKKEVMPIQRNYAVTAYMGSKLERINLRPGAVWRGKMIELLRADLTSQGERDLYWLREIKRSIAKDPAGHSRDFIKKIYMLLNYYEFAPYESINFFRKKSSFLSLPLLNFGLVAAFALLGMFFAWKRRAREALPLGLFAIVYFISLLPFPPLARYRLPVAPFLIIFAAYCMLDFYEALRGKKWKYLATCAAFFLPVFFLTNTNLLYPYLDSFSRPYYHEGKAYLQADEPGKALSSFEKALKKHPADADIYEGLGDAYFRLNDPGKAEASYKKALEIEPEFLEAMEKLGVVYGKMGDLNKAIITFQRVLSSFPVEYANTHVNLATAYSLKGDTKSQRKELERAVEMEPDNLKALYKLTELYERINAPEAPRFRKRLDEKMRRLQD
ncbi:MAG: tetratricopeptide repeat protein [Candidatus Omnitrophota bacterium]